ncbi:polyphosphate polymerase domain-containing protein [Streptococcus sp. ST16]|uniref:polyphosphate polymerase domain-containing protein n=1 Tax=Streptococcus sp. ST16 TaxID=3378283 RepID=UPI0038D399FF
MKPLETKFKRIETKYVVSKEILEKLIQDLKEYLVEDDYPISTISNIYFDTEDFDVLLDDDFGDKRKEKVRMRTYLSQPTLDSQVFLEIKTKDQEGVGRKFRLLSTPSSILNFITKGHLDASITDKIVIEKVKKLHQDYKQGIKPRMYIYYDRYSLKEKKYIEGYNYNKIRITIDQNLVYRDENVNLFSGNQGAPLLDDNTVIMEIKAPGNKPQWLQDILDKYGLIEHKFSKYSCAYHKSQGLPYAPRPNIESAGAAYA